MREGASRSKKHQRRRPTRNLTREGNEYGGPLKGVTVAKAATEPEFAGLLHRATRGSFLGSSLVHPSMTALDLGPKGRGWGPNGRALGHGGAPIINQKPIERWARSANPGDEKSLGVSNCRR